MCKKETSVPHSATEAEIVSLDAGLRMDGIPALDLWDLVKEVFHSSTNPTTPKIKYEETRRVTPHQNKHTQNQTKVPIQHDNLELSDVDDVSSNAKSFQFGAMLTIFEDNEAVIQIIIKGRSPTLRHVSRTHRVAFDWLFDRINLDPKIQIKSPCQNQNFSLTSCIETMAQRMQEQEGEERIVAKSLVSTSSSIVQNPIASKSLGILMAPCQK